MKTVQVKCAICGDTSHPTRDCALRNKGPENNQNKEVLDKEYLNFMQELGEVGPAHTHRDRDRDPSPLCVCV